MNIAQRNQLIKTLYTEQRVSMEQIGKQFGISRNRVKQILWRQGVKGSAVRIQKKKELLNKIKTLIEQNPATANRELAEQLKISLNQVNAILKTADIKRDKSLIYSKAKTRSWRKERPELTRELLFQLYVFEQHSLSEIAEKLNYTVSTIAFNLKRLGIKTRRSGPNNRS